ncbi:hypothetical protein [Microbulbifer zhoushanensis]|uniref:hypothetical protein n=1 Tax=Microbulbifer TaxID=48073 RepID=UPI001F229A7B|nr:hypothetical protein [Microbulbifer zhoushanensis]
MANSPYQPDFKMWFFSIVIAAGFGNAAVDGIKFLLQEFLKKEGELSFVDYGCWDRKTKNGSIPTCEYIFKNIGDEAVIVTDLKVGDLPFRSFHTNMPGGLKKAKFNFTNANIAQANAGDLLVVSKGPIPRSYWKKKVCLEYIGETLVCTKGEPEK